MTALVDIGNDRIVSVFDIDAKDVRTGSPMATRGVQGSDHDSDQGAAEIAPQNGWRRPAGGTNAAPGGGRRHHAGRGAVVWAAGDPIPNSEATNTGGDRSGHEEGPHTATGGEDTANAAVSSPLHRLRRGSGELGFALRLNAVALQGYSRVSTSHRDGARKPQWDGSEVRLNGRAMVRHQLQEARHGVEALVAEADDVRLPARCPTLDTISTSLSRRVPGAPSLAPAPAHAATDHAAR